MPRYRETPERKAAIDRLFQLNDAVRGEAGANRPILSPIGTTALELQWEQEDSLIEQYGRLVKFDWTITDGAGATQRVTGVSTEVEAIGKAVDIWTAAGYRVRGQISWTKALIPVQNRTQTHRDGGQSR